MVFEHNIGIWIVIYGSPGNPASEQLQEPHEVVLVSGLSHKEGQLRVNIPNSSEDSDIMRSTYRNWKL